MISGIGKFRMKVYVDGVGTFDFTPTTYCKMTVRRPVSSDINRNAFLTTDRKYERVGDHLQFGFSIYNLNLSYINSLKTTRGLIVELWPHVDFDISYYAIVESVIDRKERGRNDQIVVDILFRTVAYQKFNVRTDGYYTLNGTTECITTPIDEPPQEFYFSIDYNQIHGAVESILFGSGNINTTGMKFSLTADRRLKFFRVISGTGSAELYTGIISVPIGQPWQNLAVQRFSDASVKFYVDGIEESLDAGSDTEDIDGAINQTFRVGYVNSIADPLRMGNASIKNIIYKDKTDYLFDYHCSEPVPAGSTYTDYCKDWSFKGNDGTPIVSDKNMFFYRDLT